MGKCISIELRYSISQYSIIPKFHYSSPLILCVHPRPKKFRVCRGALPRARMEKVKGDKALFLTLDNFRHFRHFEF